jgi:iron complex transport system substrate-binding protein
VRCFWKKLIWLAGALVAALLPGVTAGASAGASESAAKSTAGKAATVVSLDFCADQYALAFIPREQILAVSADGAGPLSFYRDRAAGLPVTRASAEEVLMLRPDVVVRTFRGGPGMDALLERLGVRVVQPGYAFTYDDHLTNLAKAAETLSAPAAGAALAESLRARRAALQAAPRLDASAIYLTPSGLTAGEGSSVARIIDLAGLRSFAVEIGIKGWASLPLEEVVMGAPDMVIGSFFDDGSVNTSFWSLSRHAVFQSLIRDLPTVMVPSRFMSCSVTQAVDAAEYLRAKALEYGVRPMGTPEATSGSTGLLPETKEGRAAR